MQLVHRIHHHHRRLPLLHLNVCYFSNDYYFSRRFSTFVLFLASSTTAANNDASFEVDDLSAKVDDVIVSFGQFCCS